MNPFDYSLCDQPVTCYRQEAGEYTRRVIPRAYLSARVSTPTESYGKSRTKEFLLIIPGDVPIRPGDRIFRGIGPETVDWQQFVSDLVPQLYTVSFSKPCCWDGAVVHWEAGNRKEHL